jgi:hypothetical protein
MLTLVERFAGVRLRAQPARRVGDKPAQPPGRPRGNPERVHSGSASPERCLVSPRKTRA